MIFKIYSIHSVTNISENCFVSIFNLKDTFFFLPDWSSFDAIIGLDLLKIRGHHFVWLPATSNRTPKKRKLIFTHALMSILLKWTDQMHHL